MSGGRLSAGMSVLATLGRGAGVHLRDQIWPAPPVTEVELQGPLDAPYLPTRSPVRVLVWNIQFAATRRHHFFYDGGETVHVPRADVVHGLDRIAEVVRQIDPDIVLLQEVDRCSDRTARIDQHAELVRRLPHHRNHASTPYHQVAWVPHPGHQPMGRTDMHLSVLSRFALDRALRRQLPLLDEPLWRQAFNLRRALLDVRLPTVEGGSLHLLNTHLSAFSQGDGTLARQVATLDHHADALDALGVPWLLAGDFNALPPGDDPARLGADAAWYADDDTPVRPLFDRRRSCVDPARYLADSSTRTYLPFGASEPDRTLDYAFAAAPVHVCQATVVDVRDVSDHLPLCVELQLNPPRMQ